MTRSNHAMSPDGFNYKQEGFPAAQASFVQQQATWPEGASFAAPVHPHQAMHIPNGTGYAHNEVPRPVSSSEMAWHGFRPGSQGHQMVHQPVGHNPFCAHHGKPEGEHQHPQALAAQACCPQHHNQPVPPTVPTPPPSDGSPHSAWGVPIVHPDDPHAAKRVKLDWGGFDGNNPVVRPDGVRKKNAKFEIPEDRNLDTLDSLIKHAKSEAELKELKMQKRLLRNREAALHSRQKKKTHTEWLERERDSLSSRLYTLQHELTALRIRVDDHEREKSTWAEQLSQAEQRATGAQREKEMLAQQHARETRKLGQEILRLREQVTTQGSGTASPNSTAAPATAFSGSDDGVAFGPTQGFAEWDGGYDFMNEGLRASNEPSGADILVH